jgi:hypothetical protein
MLDLIHYLVMEKKIGNGIYTEAVELSISSIPWSPENDIDQPLW